MNSMLGTNIIRDLPNMKVSELNELLTQTKTLLAIGSTLKSTAEVIYEKYDEEAEKIGVDIYDLFEESTVDSIVSNIDSYTFLVILCNHLIEYMEGLMDIDIAYR